MQRVGYKTCKSCSSKYMLHVKMQMSKELCGDAKRKKLANVELALLAASSARQNQRNA